jgi:hypothetical protein
MLTYIINGGQRGKGQGVGVWNNQPHHHQRTRGHGGTGQRATITTNQPSPRKRQKLCKHTNEDNPPLLKKINFLKLKFILFFGGTPHLLLCNEIF